MAPHEKPGGTAHFADFGHGIDGQAEVSMAVRGIKMRACGANASQ